MQNAACFLLGLSEVVPKHLFLLPPWYTATLAEIKGTPNHHSKPQRESHLRDISLSRWETSRTIPLHSSFLLKFTIALNVLFLYCIVLFVNSWHYVNAKYLQVEYFIHRDLEVCSRFFATYNDL